MLWIAGDVVKRRGRTTSEESAGCRYSQSDGGITIVKFTMSGAFAATTFLEAQAPRRIENSPRRWLSPPARGLGRVQSGFNGTIARGMGIFTEGMLEISIAEFPAGTKARCQIDLERPKRKRNV